MSEKKPTPLVSQPNGTVCPVCGNRSYSQEGIHPQCAVRQADAVRTEALKIARKLETADVKPSSWQVRKCPKCAKELHIRRKACDCGHVFF